MISRRIRMRHLRCFLAVAQQGTVSRAAAAIGTVQPSVSRSLRELEDELGAAVFDRTPKGLVLNAAGHMLHSYIANGMTQIDRGLEAVLGRTADRHVVAYVLPNVVRMVMPGAVRRFKSFYPQIDLRFLGPSSGGLQQAVRLGQVDFGFGRLQSAESMEGMKFEHLFSEPLVFFVRAGHPLAGATGISVQDINRFQVIQPLPGTIIRDELDRFLIGKGMQRFDNVIDTISFEFSRSYLLQADAIACHPLGAMQREVSSGAIAQLDFCNDDMMGSVGISTPTGKPLSSAAQLLIENIREEVRESAWI